jgi:hypothetical protein
MDFSNVADINARVFSGLIVPGSDGEVTALVGRDVDEGADFQIEGTEVVDEGKGPGGDEPREAPGVTS